MSYHRGRGLGFTIPQLEQQVSLPTTMTLTATQTTTDPQAVVEARQAREAEIAAKEAARDEYRAEQARLQAEADRLKAEREELAIMDRTLPGQEFQEDWTPQPAAPAPVQKVPWLLIGLGVVAVGGLGYWIWRR